MKHGYERFHQYPKGSTLWLHIRCYDEKVTEGDLLHLFDKHFDRNSEFGREYFCGSVHSMIELILREVSYSCKFPEMLDKHSREVEILQRRLYEQNTCTRRVMEKNKKLQEHLQDATIKIKELTKLCQPFIEEENSSFQNEEEAFDKDIYLKDNEVSTSNSDIDSDVNQSNDDMNGEDIPSKILCCKRCGRHCSSSQRLKSHEDNCDGFDKKQCKVCLKSFVRAIDCKKHILKCDGLNNRQCKICLKIFTTRQSKHEHIKHAKCFPRTQVGVRNAPTPILIIQQM